MLVVDGQLVINKRVSCEFLEVETIYWILMKFCRNPVDSTSWKTGNSTTRSTSECRILGGAAPSTPSRKSLEDIHQLHHARLTCTGGGRLRFQILQADINERSFPEKRDFYTLSFICPLSCAL